MPAEGAICLVLPRQKLDEAVKRDCHIRSAFVNRNSLAMAGLAAGDQAEAQTPGLVSKINFGGPEQINHDSAAGTGDKDDAKEGGGGNGSLVKLPTGPEVITHPALDSVTCGLLSAASETGNRSGVATGTMISLASEQQRDQQQLSQQREQHDSYCSSTQGTPVPATAGTTETTPPGGLCSTSPQLAARGGGGYYAETPPATGNAGAVVSMVLAELADSIRAGARQLTLKNDKQAMLDMLWDYYRTPSRENRQVSKVFAPPPPFCF